MITYLNRRIRIINNRNSKSSLLNGLVAYWKMDEQESSRVDNISDYLLWDLTKCSSAPGKIGNAVTFDGTQSIYCPSNDDLKLGIDSFTWALWIKLSSKAQSTDIIGKWQGAGKYQFVISYENMLNRFRFFVRDPADTKNYQVVANNFGEPALNIWYLLICWYDKDSQTINIQVNDTTENPVSDTDGILEQALRVDFGGRYNGTNKLIGAMDEVGLWNRVLNISEKASLYNGGNGITYPFIGSSIAANKIISAIGVWSFFQNPKSIYYDGSTIFGGINELGDVLSYQYNHSTQVLNKYTFKSVMEIDDHDQPSYLILPDERILALYCRHSVSASMYQRISTNANDNTAWGDEVDIGASLGTVPVSYPNLIQLMGEEDTPIYLFYRVHPDPNRGMYMSKSIDNGTTWSAGIKWVESVIAGTMHRPYTMVIRNGNNRMDFAFNDGHPAEVVTNSLYHFYYQGGKYYKSDGTEIVTGLPITPASATKIYDGTAVNCWVYEITIDASGYPVIVYAAFPDYTSDHRYRYARWNGSSWIDNEICAAGGPIATAEQMGYYSGGIAIDHTNPDIVYCSVNTSGNTWKIYKYTTANNGITWTNVLIIDNMNKNMRPVVPFNHGIGIDFIWNFGTYITYTNYLEAFSGYPAMWHY